MEVVLDEALIYGVRPDAATAVREDAAVAVDADADTDATADADLFPVFSGRVLCVNELKAMALLEAVHSRERLQQQGIRRCDGTIVEANIFSRWGIMKDGWKSIV